MGKPSIICVFSIAMSDCWVIFLVTCPVSLMFGNAVRNNLVLAVDHCFPPQARDLHPVLLDDTLCYSISWFP